MSSLSLSAVPAVHGAIGAVFFRNRKTTPYYSDVMMMPSSQSRRGLCTYSWLVIPSDKHEDKGSVRLLSVLAQHQLCHPFLHILLFLWAGVATWDRSRSNVLMFSSKRDTKLEAEGTFFFRSDWRIEAKVILQAGLVHRRSQAGKSQAG